MSDTAVNLLSGVIGALVGGGATLAGTIFVGRLESSRRSRATIFRKLLPAIVEGTLPAFVKNGGEEDFSNYAASIAKLAREAQIAGRPERRAMREVLRLNTGSAETGESGTFSIDGDTASANHLGIADALDKMGFDVSHRIWR